MKYIVKFHKREIVALSLLILGSTSLAFAGADVPNTFTGGTVAKASEVNANFKDLSERAFDKTQSGINYSEGNVGIGTTSPGFKLHVVTSENGDQARFESTASHSGVIIRSASNSFVPFLRLETAAASPNDFEIGLDVDGDLYLSPTAMTGKTRAALVVEQGGNVGIGTTSPGAKLDVTGSGANECCAPVPPTISLAEASSTVGRKAWLQFHNAGEAEAYIRLAGGGPADSGREGQRRLEIGTSQATTTSLTVDGNIGIGTTSPGSKLSVVGLPTAPPDGVTGKMLCIDGSGNLWVDDDGTLDCM